MWMPSGQTSVQQDGLVRRENLCDFGARSHVERCTVGVVRPRPRRAGFPVPKPRPAWVSSTASVAMGARGDEPMIRLSAAGHPVPATRDRIGRRRAEEPGRRLRLTVGEAMFKSRPVVASRLGGIQKQIERDASGVLLEMRVTYQRLAAREQPAQFPGPGAGAMRRRSRETGTRARPGSAITAALCRAAGQARRRSPRRRFRGAKGGP